MKKFGEISHVYHISCVSFFPFGASSQYLCIAPILVAKERIRITLAIHTFHFLGGGGSLWTNGFFSPLSVWRGASNVHQYQFAKTMYICRSNSQKQCLPLQILSFFHYNIPVGVINSMLLLWKALVQDKLSRNDTQIVMQNFQYTFSLSSFITNFITRSFYRKWTQLAVRALLKATLPLFCFMALRIIV